MCLHLTFNYFLVPANTQNTNEEIVLGDSPPSPPAISTSRFTPRRPQPNRRTYKQDLDIFEYTFKFILLYFEYVKD